MLDQRTYDLYALDEDDDSEVCCTNADPCDEHWRAMQDMDSGAHEPEPEWGYTSLD